MGLDEDFLTRPGVNLDGDRETSTSILDRLISKVHQAGKLAG